MIVDLPNSSTTDVSKALVRVRSDVGAMALSRVLTLIVSVDEVHLDAALETANLASRQHPCRIIVVVSANARGAARMDAQIRVGGDAGASEVVILRLYGPLTKHGRAVVTPLLLADSPIIVWWPVDAPKDPSGDPIGAMASRRVTDSAHTKGTPKAILGKLAAAYRDGDTDLAWSRITLWRGLLAAALDQAPFEPVLSATVTGAPDSPSADLLAGWLAFRLRCPVRLARSAHRTGVISVRLERASGNLDLVRPQDGNVGTLSQPGQPERTIALAHRSDAQCLADELARLDPDEVYQDALTKGCPKVSSTRQSMSQAVRKGEAPSVEESKKAVRRIQRRARASLSSQMVEAAPIPPAGATDVQVKAAARKKLARKGTST